MAYRILETLEKQYSILVTSANHMPRAVAAFRKAGMDPIPAPTEYLARDDYGLFKVSADSETPHVCELSSSRQKLEFVPIL